MSQTHREHRTSSQLSAFTSQPTWAPPRAPLPPHRLAKLANALGVPTPVPATHSHVFTLAASPPVTSPSPSASPNPNDMLRRSPTPSASTPLTPSFSTSKFMLHVIPPSHLPHDSDDFDLNPPAPAASGYHPQFRRGVMVPVYSTLQSQLTAIAREYALPSTTGMVLYLVSSLNTLDSDEPGPRISEDIWRHIWTRVLKVERDELLAPGPKSFGLGLGYSLANRSTPTLLQDVAGSRLRSLDVPRLTETPQPHGRPAVSSPSTSYSAYSSQSEVDTPESATSVDPPTHANSSPLPGLDSNSPLPILAKVEFDIDKRKAGWYNTWVRSRKVNHAKRAESRLGMRSGSRSEKDGEGIEEGTRKAPIDLALVGKMNGANSSPNFTLTTDTSAEPEELILGDDDAQDGYEQLEDEPEEVEEVSAEELAARLDDEPMTDGEDPLEDVFGTDEDTWATMHNESDTKRRTNPKVVDLALDAADVPNLPDDLEEDDHDRLPPGNEEYEISELLDKVARPVLSVTVPESGPPSEHQSSPSPTTAAAKKHIPPPLDLHPSSPNELIVPEQPSPMPSSAGSAQLAYLASDETDDVQLEHRSSSPAEEDEDDDYTKSRSPEDEKRVGVFYDALNLGLDPSLTEEGNYDASDPYDRRKSQYIMSAQLDEIERNLAQFSPRRLQSEELSPDDLSRIPTDRSPSIASILTPRNREFSTPPKSPAAGATSWPAVPYSTLNDSIAEDNEDRPPSPPSFAFNGVTTDAPKSFYAKAKTDSMISNETLARHRALQEERGLYPPLVTPNMFGANSRHDDSPVIPLSPDPFGRYPSEAEATYIEEQRQSQVYLEEPVIGSPPARGSSLSIPGMVADRPPSQTPSSRFSLDSVTSEDALKPSSAAPAAAPKQSSLMSVKSIRKLWRKSDSKRASVSQASQPGSGRTSPNPAVTRVESPQPAGRSRSKSVSRQPPPPVQAGVVPVIPAVPSQHHSRNSSLQALHFNQESPYPIHPVRAPAMQPSSPPATSSRPPSVAQMPPPTSVPERSSVRKSILKSWKSASGLSSSKANSSSSTTPRSSTEQTSEASKKHKPNVLDLANGVMRHSMSSGSVTLVDIPPSPAIPERFADQFRSSSRQSQLAHSNGKTSMSSTSSPPRVRSPLNASSPPRNGSSLSTMHARASIDSYESRPSFDVSQFEMVSPPKSTLTYPYHGLDHSMISTQESP